MTNEEYVAFLERKGQGYVWQFTKQKVTNFDDIFLAAKLFNEWKKSEQSCNLEDFFIEQHHKYGITSRHRTLIIGQICGLITKNSDIYAKENVTPVFDELTYCSDVNLYKRIVTEQLLKIKLPAITVSRQNDNQDERHIFPVIFIYQVLKRLKQYRILSISIAELYTYVMTANFHSDIDRVVTFLSQPIKPTVSVQLLENYKKRSRIIPLMRNINLFIMEDDKISINSTYEQVMDNFLARNISNFISQELTNSGIYKNFMYNIQNFGINLIDDDVDVIVSDSNEDEEDDAKYTVDVAIHNNTTILSDKTIDNLSQLEPKIITEGEKVVVKRDSSIGVLAIMNSEYRCEYDESHQTFISKKSGKPYMEAHHLIPVSQSQYIWKKKHANVDCIENIVSLCPNCHRAIHHGEFNVKLDILKKLYDKKKADLMRAGLNIDFETLLKFYL